MHKVIRASTLDPACHHQLRNSGIAVVELDIAPSSTARDSSSLHRACPAPSGALGRSRGMGGRQIDEAVLTAVCNILKPAALAATAQALTHADEQEGVRLVAFETAAERTRYAAERA